MNLEQIQKLIDYWLPRATTGSDPDAWQAAEIVLRALELQARAMGLVS